MMRGLIESMGCFFLSGTTPNEICTRMALHAAASMLRDKQRRADFRFGKDDEVAGVGSVSTGNEFVILGSFGGVKCDITLEYGSRRYEASVLVSPRVEPREFLYEGGFYLAPLSYLYQGSAVGEA